jgi:hypothetical protein
LLVEGKRKIGAKRLGGDGSGAEPAQVSERELSILLGYGVVGWLGGWGEGDEEDKMKGREAASLPWRTHQQKGKGVDEQKSSSREKGELLSLNCLCSTLYVTLNTNTPDCSSTQLVRGATAYFLHLFSLQPPVVPDDSVVSHC